MNLESIDFTPSLLFQDTTISDLNYFINLITDISAFNSVCQQSIQLIGARKDL